MASTDSWDSSLSYQTHYARYRTLEIPEMCENPFKIEKMVKKWVTKSWHAVAKVHAEAALNAAQR